MEASELMLGNIIQVNTAKGFMDMPIMKEITVDVDVIKDCVEHPEKYDSVQLTKEWLLSHGFVDRKNGTFWIQDYFNRTLLFEKTYSDGLNDGFIFSYKSTTGTQGIIFSDVHKFQNFMKIGIH